MYKLEYKTYILNYVNKFIWCPTIEVKNKGYINIKMWFNIPTMQKNICIVGIFYFVSFLVVVRNSFSMKERVNKNYNSIFEIKGC